MTSPPANHSRDMPSLANRNAASSSVASHERFFRQVPIAVGARVSLVVVEEAFKIAACGMASNSTSMIFHIS